MNNPVQLLSTASSPTKLVAQIVKKKKICLQCRRPVFDSWVPSLGLVPRLIRSPGEGNGYPLQYSSLESFMGRGAWWAK